jgi:thymidylate synthase
MVKIYQPLYKPNQVFCGTGQTVIVTGWTLKGAIKKKLEEHEYGAIGQLYSPTRGINFLVRNLLWNPHIRFLIVVNATKEDKNSGAVQCLLDFFREGFKSEKSENDSYCWKIVSEVVGYVDQEIGIQAPSSVAGFSWFLIYSFKTSKGAPPTETAK